MKNLMGNTGLRGGGERGREQAEDSEMARRSGVTGSGLCRGLPVGGNGAGRGLAAQPCCPLR